MKKSVVGEWVEGDAFGTTLRGWRALLTLNTVTRDSDRVCAGKERLPHSWANRMNSVSCATNSVS